MTPPSTPPAPLVLDEETRARLTKVATGLVALRAAHGGYPEGKWRVTSTGIIAEREAELHALCTPAVLLALLHDSAQLRAEVKAVGRFFEERGEYENAGRVFAALRGEFFATSPTGASHG